MFDPVLTSTVPSLRRAIAAEKSKQSKEREKLLITLLALNSTFQRPSGYVGTPIHLGHLSSDGSIDLDLAKNGFPREVSGHDLFTLFKLRWRLLP